MNNFDENEKKGILEFLKNTKMYIRFFYASTLIIMPVIIVFF